MGNAHRIGSFRELKVTVQNGETVHACRGCGLEIVEQHIQEGTDDRRFYMFDICMCDGFRNDQVTCERALDFDHPCQICGEEEVPVSAKIAV